MVLARLRKPPSPLKPRSLRLDMATHQVVLSVSTRGKGMVEITALLHPVLAESGIRQGLLHVFCRHTSCSLVIMENADPSARHDLERYLDQLVPEHQPSFTHTLEGADDMPSHIKMALTRTTETLPVNEATLLLGTWQGVFLWEHRRAPHRRQIIVTVQGET